MQIDVRSGAPLGFNTSCLVVPVWQGEKLDSTAQKLNKSLSGLVQEVIDEDGFKGSAGETRVLYSQEKIAAPRVILLGLGKREKFNLQSLRKSSAKAARGVRTLKKSDFALVVPAFENFGAREVGTAVVEGITLGLHIYNEFKTSPEARDLTEITKATLFVDKAQLQEFKDGVALGQITAEANLLARSWVNLPSNLKSPQFFAEQAENIAKANGLRCEIWDEKKIQEEKMGALWGVGMGSDNPPRFIILEHTPPGTENDAPIALVGKGMSYDTGGYSLKPTTSMEDMKDDMGGAAVVIATMSALRKLNYPKRVLAVVPSAENMISGRAQRPGDIVRARNGKTIEVLNTDAEGRLILADALSWTTEQKPKAIIDFATLTGAIGVALGQEAAGLFGNDEQLLQQVKAAGEATGDRVWEFPMWDEYRDHVKGTVSDLKNMGVERRAGSIAAAVFLEHFVGEDIPWAHVDIAAVAFVRDDRVLTQRGATGFGVRLAIELLRNFD